MAIVAAFVISSAPVQYIDYGIQIFELKLHRLKVALYRIGWVGRFGRKPGDPVSGLLGRMTDSIGQPVVASCRAETVSVELKQGLLPSLGFRRVIFRQEIDQFAYAAGSVSTDHELFVCVFHDAGITDREAFGFERQNVGNYAIGVNSERQPIVACPTGPLLFFGIWFVRFTRQKTFIYQIKMLKFLIVKAEEERRNHPVGMSDCSEVLHREHAKRFSKIPLK